MALEQPPGRYLDDKDRSAFGLGWEYARRGWSVTDCPYRNETLVSTFVNGFDAFTPPTSHLSNAAMLNGIPEAVRTKEAK